MTNEWFTTGNYPPMPVLQWDIPGIRRRGQLKHDPIWNSDMRVQPISRGRGDSCSDPGQKDVDRVDPH